VLNFILKHKVQYKSNRFIFGWLLSFVSLGLLSVFFIIAYVTGKIAFNNLRFSYTDLLMHLAAYVNIFCVLYRPSLLDGITFNALVFRLPENDRHSEPGEEVERLKKYEVYAQKLESYFANEKPFLDSDLTLDKAANKLQISTKELSRTTSYIYELGYPDFVNSWRINYIVEQRISDKQWQSYSRDMLAELGGFGSRQALHNAINRLHRTTPAAFFTQKANKN
jgi:AraC-like DNA-binding protein